MTIIEDDADVKIADVVRNRVHPRCTPDGRWYLEGKLNFVPAPSFEGVMPSRLKIEQVYKYKSVPKGRIYMTLTISHLDTIDGVYTYVVEGEETKK